ncbi:glycosyltransferase [Burkholderia sp. AU28942]|uniref:glycosyltransferase n=1 Tax=Burkholderia TaxID=32008 RepID=UPI000841E92D|nr:MULTISPECIES: glycosyltransferase [Burkholderia]MCA8307009.1 glycosyltransferase [Burkholderia sp. AU28942]
MLFKHLIWHVRRIHFVAQRVTGSVATRGWRNTIARIAQEFRPPSATSGRWTLESLQQPFSPFALPTSSAPQVSVIVPAYGKLAYTLACLRSIARHGADAAFEVIVVDDASPDDSTETLSQIEGLRLIRNERNLGFIGSCNAGAAAALGTYLLFLNNDTQVTPGWLDQLLACFAEESDCGIAGSRLVYPDGRLQEAGGIVFSDASAWNFGRFESPDNPQFLYRRRVDYISGAAMMIDAALFGQLGGLDARYAPAYYEDTDLAFAVRAAGKQVFYQPQSLVIHNEGISSGTDTFSGVKQYQVINREKFRQKWAAELAAQPAPGTPAVQAIQRAASPHILIVDALTPDASRDSGSLRMINIMRLLSEMGWRISFMASNRLASHAEITALGRIGVHVLCKPWAPSLTRWLKREGSQLGAVMLCRHYVAAPNLALVKRLAPQAQILFDTVDLHFLREQRAAAFTNNPALARKATLSRKRELTLIRACDVTFVVSPIERDLLMREVPDASVELLSNVHDVPGRHAGFATREGLVFVGGFSHSPNEDAVRWLVDEIFPRIRAKRPDIALHIVGDMPGAAQSELAGPGIHIHGRVPDLTPWMDGCRVALAPLRYGAGVKGKVNMAMSYGLPVVATHIAAEGMQLSDGDNVLLSDDAEGFAAAVLRAYEDETLWNQLSDRGMDNVRQYFSLEAARSVLRRVLPPVSMAS